LFEMRRQREGESHFKIPRRSSLVRKEDRDLVCNVLSSETLPLPQKKRRVKKALSWSLC